MTTTFSTFLVSSAIIRHHVLYIWSIYLVYSFGYLHQAYSIPWFVSFSYQKALKVLIWLWADDMFYNKLSSFCSGIWVKHNVPRSYLIKPQDSVSRRILKKITNMSSWKLGKYLLLSFVLRQGESLLVESVLAGVQWSSAQGHRVHEGITKNAHV